MTQQQPGEITWQGFTGMLSDPSQQIIASLGGAYGALGTVAACLAEYQQVQRTNPHAAGGTDVTKFRQTLLSEISQIQQMAEGIGGGVSSSKR